MDLNEHFLQAALDSLKQDIFSNLRTAMPGNIVSYDAAFGTATVQPALRRQTSSGEILTAPELLEVPVYRPTLDISIFPGDPCILIFMDFCMDGWLTNHQPVLPPSPRMHDWSDAIALVGFFGGEAS